MSIPIGQAPAITDDGCIEAPLARRLRRAARTLDATLDATLDGTVTNGRVLAFPSTRRSGSAVDSRPVPTRRALIVGLSAGAFVLAGVLAVPTGSVAAAASPGTMTPPVTTAARIGEFTWSPPISAAHPDGRTPQRPVDASGPPPQTTSPRNTSPQRPK